MTASLSALNALLALPARGTLTWPRAAAALLAAAATASLVAWGLRISGTGSATTRMAVASPARLPEAAEPERVARLLAPAAGPVQGAASAAPASRLQLTGVAAGLSGRGAALIAVDGRPPRPYGVGTAVADGLVLQAVHGRRAELGASVQGPASLVLELPPLPR